MKNNEKVRYFIGLDIHKSFTAYAVLDKEGNIHTQNRIASNPEMIYNELEFFLKHGLVGFETNTEVYPINNYLVKNNIQVKVANTHKIRTLISTDDDIDAKRLADLLRLNAFPEVFLPSQEVRRLRDLINTRQQIIRDITSAKNQILAICRREGWTFPDTGNFTKKWYKTLIAHEANYTQMRHLRYLMETYEFLCGKSERITAEMEEYTMQEFPNQLAAIDKIKGFGGVLACYVIGFVHPISRFANIKKLRRYAGVIPVSQISANKNYATFVPKAYSNSLLHYALFEAANAARRFDKNIQKYYEKKLEQKHRHKMALAPIARLMCDKVFQALSVVN